MIRRANFADIPRLAELVEQMHGTSRYAALGLDMHIVRALLLNSVQRHGKHHDGCTWIMVDEAAGQVEGFIIGMLDRVYHICDKLAAKDMYLFATESASRNAASLLIDSYIKWADENPNVYEINLSHTDAVEGGERIGKLYERKGFVRCGAIYVRGKL